MNPLSLATDELLFLKAFNPIFTVQHIFKEAEQSHIPILVSETGC